MSTLTALAQAQAWAAGRAEPIATVRHLHLHERPLVLVPLAMAGEANAPLAAMIGTSQADARLLVVAQPRNRDQRFAFAAELADVVVSYLQGHCAVAEAVAVDRGRDVRYRYVDAPQVWVPNPAGVDFLRLFGRSTRFRRVDGEYPVPPSVPLLGRWLTFLANSAEVPGSSLLLNAVQAVGLHWVTGQSATEDQHLAAQLAWIDPPDGLTGAQAARAAEDPAHSPPAGPATDPEFDNTVLAPLMSAYSDDPAVLPELTAAVRTQVEPTWRLMWTALRLLRTLPAGERVASRWAADRDAFSAFAQHTAEGGAPQPRRDGAVAAAARLHRLEHAATRFAVQRAFDDPLVMAEYRLAGEAFTATVTLAQADRVDDSGRRPVLRPRLMITTTEPVRVGVGAALYSPARPGQKATVISVTPTAAGATEVLLELSGGMGRKLVAEPGSVPAVGETLLYTTLSEVFRPGGAFPEVESTPWTHGGPPQPVTEFESDAELEDTPESDLQP
ncbi:MAG TPA: hypothetical protein VFO77_09920 [Actinoplanes sp.]|nr:hypothetical protein [Actinoplanes sp.]